jgi:glycosyltransferase involved in cell wall biosynthesis
VHARLPASPPPRVSVLLPYRDAAPTLGAAIESLLGEALPFELIAADDGSRDDGPALVRALASRHRCIVPIATGGLGIPGALNLALAHARAPFVARMDADDLSLPQRLSRSLALLERDPRLAAVGTRVEAFADGELGEGMRRYVAWMNTLLTPEEHARDLFVESPLCHPSVMMRRSALEAVGGYHDPPWAEDYDLWLRLDAAGFSLAKVPETLLRWRHSAGRATLRDPRYLLARFDEAKAHYLAPRLRRLGRPVAVWGAGKTGKRIGRALAREGVSPTLYLDIDPRKIGRTAQGALIRPPESLERGRFTVVVAVGAQGARDIVRGRLRGRGFLEGEEYIVAS